MGLLGVSCPHQRQPVQASNVAQLVAVASGAVAQAELSMCCMQQTVPAATATGLKSTRTSNAWGSSSTDRISSTLPNLSQGHERIMPTMRLTRCPERTGELFKIEFSINAWNRAGLANRLSMSFAQVPTIRTAQPNESLQSGSEPWTDHVWMGYAQGMQI